MSIRSAGLIRPLVLFTAVLLAAPVQANEDLDGFHFGGGVSSNSVSGSRNAIGAQFFGGYDFGPILGDANLLAEVGYMDSDFISDGRRRPSAQGLWATAVAQLPLTGYWSLLGRAGLDFGDDDGLMVGVGGAWQANQQLQLRGEIIARDNIDSFQFNVVYGF
ncbi:outer membrane beta-barrel protein [Gammaproteobacteria bacterium AB-CW1]|uniref:Outer membrane beta-barrel protein n=1 Tax=Natronospira elongata TaxID=3110268 RepID=A0AAP6JDQ0_9GAMM|nr:outer membrane beta-barrel protein [Gammaproteobacteria bacterium AB-CW1]